MRKWLPWVFVAAAFGFSAAVYSHLPTRVPTHWNAAGEINGWSGRPFAAFFMPMMMVGLTIILPFLPAIDPKRANYEKFRPTYDMVVAAIIGLQLVIHVGVLGAGLGWPISIERVVPIGVGALLLFLGNVMPKARPNWWFGIRTPWTLTNDRVWEKTHRVGGYVFVIAGAALMLVATLPASQQTGFVVGIAVSASLIPVVYSYFAWKKEMTK